ncbi:MAG TPA: hypothetical protein VJ738_01870 [Steroidobacteraceae bacterium]|nr:hypothetical protein [Steroidobacteraceae bacterium]
MTQNDRSSTRTFEDAPAVRSEVPLFCGLFAPTGGGKTYSALRLATGIQRVVGGDIFGIDTESNRMKHYADWFRFRHVPFRAPFSPDDYAAAIRHCVSRGAKTIIVDSASHEHEGQGGVLEWHEAETQRLAEAWRVAPGAAQMAAWGPPKAARRRLLAAITSELNCNVIFCFRAREKLKIQRGKDPIELGWMPIGGEELFFEMTLSTLLLPSARGVPHWKSDMPGEAQMLKLPRQFADYFGGEPRQLDEDTGQRLAEWAAGSPQPQVSTLLEEYARCDNADALKALEVRREAAWRTLPPALKRQLKEASDVAHDRLRGHAEAS